LYQFQERPVAKWGAHVHPSPPRGDATAFELDSLLAANAWFTDIPITWAKKVRLQTLCHNSVKLPSLSVIFFKSANLWQSYKQEGACIEHFVHLATTLVKDEESARDNHFIAFLLQIYQGIFQ